MGEENTAARARAVRTYLAFIVAACIVPAALLGAALIGYDYYHRERARIVRDSTGTARAMVHEIDRELAAIRLAAQVFATSQPARAGEIEALRARAIELVGRGLGANVVLSDASGRQLLNTLRKPGEPLPMHGNLEQLRAVFATAQPVISDLYTGGVTRRPVMSVDVPVLRDGSVAYDLSVGVLPGRFLALLQEQKLPEGWIGAVFDRAGTVVARTHEHERFVGQKGSPALVQRMAQASEDAFDSTTLEGIPVLTVFSRSSVSGWTVALGIPEHQLVAQLWYSMARLLLVTMVTLGIALGLALVLSGRLTRLR